MNKPYLQTISHVFILLLLTNFLSAQTCRQQDSLSLVSLYTATGGANWTKKWDLTQPMSSWNGITLSIEGCVAQIILNENNLRGSLPNLQFSNLTDFVLGTNQITGTIPKLDMPNLSRLDLGVNQLIGSIPNFNMPKLTNITLWQNQLTGNIPNFNAPDLQFLHLSYNKLTGEVPNFNMPNLYELHLQDNQLSGVLPKFNMPKLLNLRIYTNQFSGNFPNLNLPNLLTIYAEGCNFTGNIPDFNLPQLVHLDLEHNKISGTIPNFNLPNLTDLLLFNNKLTGEIPDFNLPKLVNLRLGVNKLTGSVPDFNLPNLETLTFADNLLTGTIPNFSKLTKLKSLRFYINKFTGGLPEFNMPDLVVLDVYDNNLNGFIAPLSKKVVFTGNNNNLTFEDILPNVLSLTEKNYQPQDSVYHDTTLKAILDYDFTIDLKIDAAMADSKYEWFRNNLPYKVVIGSNKLSFVGVKLSDEGVYTCKITNPRAPLLTLYSRKITLTSCSLTNSARDSMANVALETSLKMTGCGKITKWAIDTNACLGFVKSIQADNTNNCTINGGLPPEIGNFKNAENISFSQLVGLKGDLPATIGGLNLLKSLKLIKTNMQGAIPTSINELQNLEELVLESNFSDLPDVSNLQKLKTLKIANNQFTFKDILPNMKLLQRGINFTYSPQQAFYKDTTLNVVPSNTLTINLGIDGGVAGNRYKWFKNGVLLETTTENTLSFKSITPCDEGVYTVEVTNANAPLLTLRSNKIMVKLVGPAKEVAVKKISAVICTGQSYALSNKRVSVEGIYRDTVRSLVCSSIDSFYIVTDLKITPPIQNTVNPVICKGVNFVLPNAKAVNTEGSYPVSLKTPEGCDSIVTYNLKITPTIQSLVNAVVCKGKKYILPDGKAVDTEGAYFFQTKNAEGCDSIVTTELKIAPVLKTTLIREVCKGKNYILPNGKAVNTEGSYEVMVKTTEGCDSLIVTNLTIAPVLRNTLTREVCKGKNHILPDGKAVNTEGSYDVMVKTSEGCDSLITTNLKITPVLKTNINTAICKGKDHVLPDGKAVNTEGVFSVTIKTKEGCDSLVTTLLKVNPTYNYSISAQFCRGNSFTLPNGRNVSVQGTYPVLLRSKVGCDSLITVSLKPMPSIESVDDKVIFREDMKMVEIRATSNDDIAKNEGWKIEQLTSPKYGILTTVGKGEFEYELTRPRLRIDTFSYRICYNTCVNECDTSLVLIDVQKPAPPSGTKSIGIIPTGNDANRRLSFPELDNPLKYPNNDLLIINRWGQVVYKAQPYLNDWEGKNQNNQELPAGTYYYILRLNLNDGKVVKGDVTVFR
jgi:hypothetical protein